MGFGGQGFTGQRLLLTGPRCRGGGGQAASQPGPEVVLLVDGAGSWLTIMMGLRLQRGAVEVLGTNL